jgi:DNA end-binding protein Ku
VTRCLWKGATSFGLVHIPIELHPAEQHQEPSVAMLDKRDLSLVG